MPVKGTATRLRIAVLDGEGHEKVGLAGLGPHLWRAASNNKESIVLENVPSDAAFDEGDIPFLAFLEESSVEEIVRLPKGDLALRTLGWHAPTGLHRCHRADVSNVDLKVLPQWSSAGGRMGLGVRYMGREAIAEGAVVLIAYGTVSNRLVADRHENTAMFLRERVSQTPGVSDVDTETLSGLFLLNDGIVSKAAFVNHSCEPNCVLSTVRVVHKLGIVSCDATTLGTAMECCSIITTQENCCNSGMEELGDALSALSVSDPKEVMCEVLLPALISVKAIMPGDFLSFDYDWTVTEASGPIRCACSAKACRGWLRQPRVGKRRREEPCM